MRRIENKEIQPILFQMLLAFKAYCEKHDIEFLLCGGTLLGAVRHQGFIPWDDDIDVYIMREGREKITELAKNDEYLDEEKRYRILIPGKKPNCYPFIKIVDTKTAAYEKTYDRKRAQGLWLDVFCLSYWPDSIEDTKKELKKFKILRRLNWTTNCGGPFTRKKHRTLAPLLYVLKFFLNMFGLNSQFWCRRILAMDHRTSGKYVGDVTWPNSIRDRFEVEWFDGTVDLMFEGTSFKAPKGYHEVLTHFYGDYMQIPPVEKRIMHAPECYYLDEE